MVDLYEQGVWRDRQVYRGQTVSHLMGLGRMWTGSWREVEVVCAEVYAA